MSDQPEYVKEALRGLTPTQKRYVIDGCIHGDITMATVRALKDRALFYFHPTSPNGRCGDMRLTPLGVTVQAILKASPGTVQAPNTFEVGKPAPYFCPACQAVPRAGYCKLKGCPTAPAVQEQADG